MNAKRVNERVTIEEISHQLRSQSGSSSVLRFGPRDLRSLDGVVPPRHPRWRPVGLSTLGGVTSWHPRQIEIEPTIVVLNPLEQCLELVALEWPLLVALLKLDDHAVFLNIGYVKSIVRERCDEGGTFGEVVEFVEKCVPTDAERHIQYLTDRGKIAASRR